MRSFRFLIAVSIVFALLSFAEAGIIKDFFTGYVKKKDSSTAGADQNHGTPSQGAGQTNEDYRSSGSRPSGQYGAAGTYTKKPVVIDGTTEKYKNTSWYIENEDYLTPNKNEQKQQRPNGQYGGAGTYTVKPMVSTTQKFSGNYPITGENHQARPTDFANNNNFNNNNNYNNNNNNNYNNNYNNNNQGFSRGSTSGINTRVSETVRSSIGNLTEEPKAEKGNNPDKIVLESDDVTCCYSNIKDKIENRILRCSEIDCSLDKVYDKSSLWVCGTMKCTIANVDFSEDHGNKKLLECSDGRNIITVQDKPLNCGPNEKAHNGKCRKVFDAAKPDLLRGC